jgi:hypothetical protein
LADTASVPALVGVNAQAIERAIEAADSALGLRRLAIDDVDVHASLFEARDSGAPRVAFLINPTPRDLEVSWSFAPLVEVRDAITNEQLSVEAGALRVPIPCRSVRMLELAGIS